MAKKLPAAVQRVKFSSLQYNTKAGRYLSTTGKTKGRFIGPPAVRQIIDDDIETTAERMRKSSAKLKKATEWYSAGGMTKEDYAKEVEAWRGTMARQIKALHLANTAAARGGFHNLDSADYGRAGAAVREQYKALSAFAKEVAADPRLITGTPGRMDFERRAGMYAQAGRGTYHKALHAEQVSVGNQTMRNVLEPGAKHCTGKGSCIEMDELGTISVNNKKFLFPTFRTCTTECKCGVEYFRAPLQETSG